MARLRKNEVSPDMGTAAAAPARRRTAPAVRKRTPAPDGDARELEQAEPVSEPVVAVISEAVTIIEYAPAHEEIAALAYGYWLERGSFGGDAEQDWLRAETELRRRSVTNA